VRRSLLTFDCRMQGSVGYRCVSDTDKCWDKCECWTLKTLEAMVQTPPTCPAPTGCISSYRWVARPTDAKTVSLLLVDVTFLSVGGSHADEYS